MCECVCRYRTYACTVCNALCTWAVYMCMSLAVSGGDMHKDMCMKNPIYISLHAPFHGSWTQAPPLAPPTTPGTSSHTQHVSQCNLLSLCASRGCNNRWSTIRVTQAKQSNDWELQFRLESKATAWRQDNSQCMMSPHSTCMWCPAIISYKVAI